VAVGIEDLRVLRKAEQLADQVWGQVQMWTGFQKDTVGLQLVRAVDSVGANIAEAFGRFHYGEKLRFLYYARGSVFESKYWLDRAHKRKLIDHEMYTMWTDSIEVVARQLNAFARSIQQQKNGGQGKQIRESSVPYTVLMPWPDDNL